jgi:hypothetical protein
MDGQWLLDGFGLQNQRLFHHDVDHEIAIDQFAFVNDRQTELRLVPRARARGLSTEARLVNRLQRTLAERPMHLDGAADDPLRVWAIDQSHLRAFVVEIPGDC